MLIGLHGKARCGKDTCYQIIAEWAQHFEKPVRREAFADRIKVSAARALGETGTWEDCVALCNDLKAPGWEVITRGPDGVERSISGREFIQRYGTEAHREIFGQDFWIESVLKTYQPPAILVVTDVRFPNEAEGIRALDGEVWHVVRDQSLIAEDDHIPEQPLPRSLIDQHVHNHGSVDDLRRAIRHRMYAYLGYGQTQVGLIH